MSNFNLTNMEVVVLNFIAQGYTCKEIAHELGTKERTVRNQMETVKLKLRARNSPHAVAIAKDKGLI